MTLQEWKALQTGGGRMAVAPAPVAAETPDVGDDGALGERYHPNSADTPDSAFIGELARTGKEAGIGLLRGIPDTVTNLYGAIRHPLDTLMGIGHAVANPTETVMNLAKSPRDAGSLLSQTLLAPKLPGMANAALAEGPGIVGRGVSAVGRGTEALGQSKAVRGASKLGAIGSVLHGNVPGALAGLAPDALEMTGRGLQKGGAALEGLDLSLKENPFKKLFKGGDAPVEAPYEPKSAEKPYRMGGTADVNGARGEEQAAANKIIRNEFNAPTRDIRYSPAYEGLKESIAKATGDDAWAGDKSAVADAPPLDSRISGLSPIEEFYANDPQARTGGEGRMTGQFKEGSGGLADAAAGRLARYDSPNPRPAFTHEGFLQDLHGSLPEGVAPPSPLDEIARLSGRGLSPADAQKLMDRFKDWKVE